LYSIQLNNLTFFGYHGVFPEEKQIGNHFAVSLDIHTSIHQKAIELADTIDYSAVFTIVKQRMQIPTPLLETLAAELVDSIATLDTRITEIEIIITKKRPPIAGFIGDVSVRYKKAYA
jgi:dihydroneopterin aldolase